MRPVCTWLAEELPRVRSLSGRIEEELQGRVAHLGKVSAPLHFLSRASVALVPFGVMTVNFLGILRLMANMLQCVGMRGDSSANRALGLLGAKSAAFVTAIDSMGDVYSFAVFSTVLADLQGLGLVEAAAAMDVLDGLMLGSISVVTGAVSALGAYLSRPIVVRAAAEFLASLQTIHVLNPAMRRETERRAKGGKGARKGKGGRKSGGRRGRGKEGAEEGEEEEEELRLLLQRSERKSGLRRPGSAAGVVAASAAAAVAAAEEGCGVREGPSGAVASAGGEGSFPLEEEAQGGASSSAPDEGSDGDSDGDGDGGEEEEEDDSTEGEEQVSGAELEQGPLAAAADAAADAGVGVERGSGGAEQEPVTAAPGAGAVSAAKLSRAEKKTQALASRQAAREAKAAAAAAKAAAKAEAKAAALEERQCKRQEKQQQREQRAAAKAAAKARGPALELAVQGGGAGGMAQRAAAIGVGGGDGAAAAPGAAAAKEPWWRRRKASTATAREGGDGAPQEGVTREGAVGAAGERSSDSGSGSSSGTADGAAGGGEQNDKALRKRLEASLSRKARLGLDEETCRGLMDFLDLPDEEKMKMGWIAGKPAEEDLLTFYARFACDAAVMKTYFPERQMLSIFINALPSSLHDKVKGHADGLPAPVDLEAVAQYAYNVYNSYQADNLLDTETFLMTTSTRAGGNNNRPPPPYCKGCDSKSTDPQDHRRSCWVGNPAQARPDWKPRSRELFAVWEKIKAAGGRQQAQRALVTRGEEAWEDFATTLVNSVVGETTGGRQQPPRVLVTRGEGAWKGGATRQ
ncbi:hypothetical protein PLESTB_001496400 [Pleodorina starrii]|uniref:Uncharacterized protein n=1 Tax=Pleodorina starrii TaxID=330485 RepID=A0A9W6BWH5_9CHLO|nr:hypothetical protein PLESTB_001496400 [Pleodorina starrii]